MLERREAGFLRPRTVAANTTRGQTLRSISDSRNKELAFKRLRRLAVSGLPLEPFVMALFEVMNDAIPSAPLKAFAPPHDPLEFICNSAELYRAVSDAKRFFFEANVDLAKAGLRIPQNPLVFARLSPGKVIWKSEDTTLPTFHRTEAFNTVTRPLSWWKTFFMLFQDDGHCYGGYPIWRGTDQKDFSQADYAFAEMCAPFITHGLKVARLTGEPTDADELTFVRSDLWGIGLVLMDRDGRAVAVDESARLSFTQLTGLNGDGDWSRKLAGLLKSVHSSVMSMTLRPQESVPLPAVRLVSHWTGAVIKLAGAVAYGSDGNHYVRVLVERGETTEIRRKRITARWGLSEREAQVLNLISEGKTNFEIGMLLEISELTVKKHIEHILRSLSVETRAAAAASVSGWR